MIYLVAFKIGGDTQIFQFDTKEERQVYMDTLLEYDPIFEYSFGQRRV